MKTKRIMDQMDKQIPRWPGSLGASSPARLVLLKGNPQEALATLEGAPRAAAETYLSALFLEAKGDVAEGGGQSSRMCRNVSRSHRSRRGNDGQGQRVQDRESIPQCG